MEMSAFSGYPDEKLLPEDCLQPNLEESDFEPGQPVQVRSGPLAGLGGLTHHQALDGRWVVELDEMAPGVFLCIDAAHLAYN